MNAAASSVRWRAFHTEKTSQKNKALASVLQRELKVAATCFYIKFEDMRTVIRLRLRLRFRLRLRPLRMTTKICDS